MVRKRAAPVLRMPWDPILLELREISLIKAIDPAAIAVIMKLTGGGGGFGNPFVPGGDGDRATSFGCGKLWVGNTIVAIRGAKMPGPKPEGSGPHAIPVGPEPTD